MHGSILKSCTAHRASRNDLVLENIFRFSIQLVSELIDPRYLFFESWTGRVAEEPSNRLGHERRPVCRQVVDLFGEIVRDGDLHAHGFKVSEDRWLRNGT
jgi:hypothetical protein